MRLLLTHPELPSCADCQKYVYSANWEVERKPARTGLPLLRPKGGKTPCYKCPKIPQGVEPIPASAIELTPANLRAWEHYQECRAVGQFPDDPIVRRNARLCRQAEDEAAEIRAGKRLLDLVRVLYPTTMQQMRG